MVGNVYGTMTKQASAAIEGKELLLLAISRISKASEDGTVVNNVAIDAEVPRGVGAY